MLHGLPYQLFKRRQIDVIQALDIQAALTGGVLAQLLLQFFLPPLLQNIS
jgi:hypothetical protein